MNRLKGVSRHFCNLLDTEREHVNDELACTGAVTTNDGTPGAAEDIKPETLNSLESALAALVK